MSLLAIAVAVFGALTVPGEPEGLSLALTVLFLLVAVALGTREALDHWDATLLLMAAALATLFLFRSATWVLAINFAVSFVLASIGTARARGWEAVFRAPARLLGYLPRGVLFVLRPVANRIPAAGFKEIQPALRGVLIGALAVGVFGALFVTADRAFASLAERFLVPDWNVDLIPARLLVAVGCLALAGSLALLSPASYVAEASVWSIQRRREFRFELQPIEWKTALFLVDLLFGAFVVVQVAVLFGDHRYVLETEGLTYSEYARQGFFQLLIVAFLTLGVIAAVVRLGRQEYRDRLWKQILLGVLSLLTVVILASALKRMNLYQEAYGFTRLRLLVDVTILWLSGIFLLLLVAGALWRGSWLPRAVVALSAITVFTFNLYNPDARIAERNVERYLATGYIDLWYLASLSPDAVAELAKLPEPQRSCVLAPISARMDPSASVWGVNVSRERARDTLEPLFGATATLEDFATCQY